MSFYVKFSNATYEWTEATKFKLIISDDPIFIEPSKPDPPDQPDDANGAEDIIDEAEWTGEILDSLEPASFQEGQPIPYVV